MATAAEGRIARVAEAEAVEVLGLITIDHNRANRAPTSPLTQVKLDLNVLEGYRSGHDFVFSPDRLLAAGGLVASKIGGPSGDRLLYLATCLIGQPVEVQVKNGSLYTGIFHATNADKDFGMVNWSLFRFGELCRLSLFIVL